jgi:serine/threonine protein kinase
VFVPAVGQIVANRYTLTQVLGRGGMGEVWRAHDQDLDSPCAIKFILPHLANDRGTCERFVREARAVARLSSPHVVHVLGVGEEDGILYLALQLLEGETLRSRLLRVGKLHPTVTLELAEQVGDALENARDAGIVHRDLKPENIWCWSGNKMFAKVLDFGVAKSALTAPSLETATGALLGTPQYMSPEQVLGNKDIDHCSDLWALTLIIVECLTGKRPFDGSSIGNLLIEIASGRVPPLKELGPELPEGLAPWWARALARNPRDRYQSATELVDALRPYLARPSAAPSQAPPVSVASSGRRMSNASIGAASRSNPQSSPPRAIGRRLLAAAGLVTLAILVLSAGVRLIGPRETGANAVAGAARSDMPTQQNAERGPQTEAKATALPPKPRNGSPRPTAATQPQREPRVTVVDDHLATKEPPTKEPPTKEPPTKEPDAAPVKANSGDARNHGAPLRAVDDALGLRDDRRDDALETSAAEQARKARLKELERQLGLLPDRE